MKKAFSLLLFWLATSSAFTLAQEKPGLWLNVSYTYTDFIYKEPGYMSERGKLAGVRGELGFHLMDWLAVSAGGDYADGHLLYDGATFGGTPVKQVTNDYMRDLRYLVHVSGGGFELAAGVAQRYWFNDLQISYRRRTRYDYNPILLTYAMGNAYVVFEKYLWQKGWNKSHMHDVNAAAHDVEFKLGDGDGMGAELGYIVPNNGKIATQLFVRYQQWSVKESDVQNDGTQNLIEPKNNTTILQFGIGLIF